MTCVQLSNKSLLHLLLQLLSYMSQFFTSDRMAVVGVGVDHDQLCAEGSKFTPFNPTGNDGDPVLYMGGEQILVLGT